MSLSWNDIETTSTDPARERDPRLADLRMWPRRLFSPTVEPQRVLAAVG
jgi:hypothetical protein